MAHSVLGDIHTHTLYSRHAYSTILENIQVAHARGLEVYGAADHFGSMMSPTVDIRDYQFFLNVMVWPREWEDMLVLRGAEVDIVGLDGALFGQDIEISENIVKRPYPARTTLFNAALSKVDYLVASVHNGLFARGASLAQTTDMYLSVLDNPKVFILGHTGRSGIPYDLDAVLLRAKETHKLIEINEHSFDGGPAGSCTETCRTIAERCAELGVGIAVSTDAHIATDIALYPRALAMLEEIHFPEELIMTRSRAALVEELAASGVCDLRDIS